MEDVAGTLIQLFILTFVLSSMLGAGLSLTLEEIVKPLSNWKVILIALVVNFVLVPLLAYAIGLVLNMSDGGRIGLMLLASCAGAPFLPKLVTTAKGDTAFSVGLMVLLMVVTVIYAPLVLPMLIPGVSINPWDIARPLIVLMLLPLVIGLLARMWAPDGALALVPTLGQAGNISLILTGVFVLLVGSGNLFGAIGSGAFIANILLFLGAIALGYFLSIGNMHERIVTGLGAGQRNFSAALLIATSNFSDTQDVLLLVVIGSVVGFITLFTVAGYFGRQSDGKNAS
ncbi:MAG: bile acid:sodium symporter family protein [Caldilineaceae bacterium]|nr:bile acid:sodium symporter family protein [Caldilineaceae bacterium]